MLHHLCCHRPPGHSRGKFTLYLLFVPTVNCQSCFNVQFVCGDGRCLNRNNDDNGVCDGITDCSDGSDEQQCGRGLSLLNGL